jgi:hypothetical protein
LKSMKRKDIVKAIWKMGRGTMIDEWVESIADEFIALHVRIANLEKLLAKLKKPEALKGERRS